MGDISIEKARKEFGDETVAVDDVDLEIADGEFVVFVGPSGCGKTTLLRLVAGLESLTSGEIRLGGEAISKQPASQRDIAMVFQNYALYPHMSVARNVGYPLKQRRVPKDQIASRVERIAEALEIGHLLQRKPGQLSGGQRQRVALARAIVRDPQAFLMDEPLSNLDAKLRVETRSEIVALQRRLDTTTLYVTHDQVEAMTMGDRIAVMYDGVLQQYGPPLELFANPANTFVASFLGTPPMNLLRGQLDLADGNRRFVLDGGSTCELALPERCPLPPRLADGRELRLGIRPRGLVPTDAEGDDHDRVRVTGRVRRTEQHGDLSYATLELGSQEVTVALDWLQVPATLDLEVAPDDLRWFDRDGLAVEVAA